ncbi:MAG: hypothetical protein AAB402_03470 [Patescibacteria group bacterium]
MYSPLHAAAGLLLAQAMPDPVTAFAAGAASHYLLDAFPHGDTGLGEWLAGGHSARRIATVESVDLGLAAIVVLALIAGHPSQGWIKLVAGAGGGITPDLFWGGRLLLDRAGWRIPLLTSFLHRHDRWHSWGHAKHFYDVPFAVGLVIQAVLLSLVLFLHV